MTDLPYRSFSSYLSETFGYRVQKISLDAGLGCPNRIHGKGCIYCNDRGSGTGAWRQGIGLKEQIKNQIEAMTRRYKAKAFIAYFQSFTNTYAPVERLKKIYDVILDFPEIEGLSIGTRPDCIDAEKLSLIETYSDKRSVWVEYGLQSANDATLKRINRGHDTACFIDAVRLTSNYNVRTCAHVIIGLPGEGMKDYIHTARLVASLGVDDIKIHLLYVTRSTPMETMYLQGDYTPIKMDAYVEAVGVFLSYLPKDMVIQRITGDPHPQELVTPLWAIEKKKVMTAIVDHMNHNHIYQGKNCRENL
ncbi:MAG: TIGR01212 family radical SAM protein [Thermodesulfobacteriota bacterium]|nr:TIGR01212 family radical SAM protein [Thermodesulfobacteriota bacterium]